MKKAFIHLATGFEEIEAITPIDILRRAGIEVQIISVTGKPTVIGSHGIAITADKLFHNADYSRCDMIILPGGLPGSSNLCDHPGLSQKLTSFANDNKWIAAICAAPAVVLDAKGLTDGKEITCYPSYKDELRGAKYKDLPVIISDNFITASGAGTAAEFGFAMVSVLKSKELAEQLKSEMLY